MIRTTASKNYVSFELTNLLKTHATYLLQKSTVEIQKLVSNGKSVCFQNFPNDLRPDWIMMWSNLVATAEEGRQRNHKSARELVRQIIQEKYDELKYSWPIEPLVFFSQVEEVSENKSLPTF